MSSLPETIGQRIRRRRSDKGMTLPRLSEASGVAKGYLSELESDKAGRPSATTLFKVATALGTSIADLLGEEPIAEAPIEVPESLKTFARRANLTEADVKMLAAIQYRGARPETEDDWQYLFESIRRSVKREANGPVGQQRAPGSWRSRHAELLVAATGITDVPAAMRRLARDLLDRSEQTEPPSNLRLLASMKGIIDIQQVDMAEAGRLIPTADGLVIQVNKSNSHGRQNFTIAHEIGHTLLPTYSSQPVFRHDRVVGRFTRNNEEEYLCDIAASALLFPDDWLRRRAQALGPSLDAVRQIALECDASFEATALSWAQLNLWPAAIVFWEETLKPSEMRGESQVQGAEPRFRIARSFRSRDFPFFLPRYKSADEGSIIEQSVAKERASGPLPLEHRGTLVPVHCEAIGTRNQADESSKGRVVSLLMAH